MTDFQAPQPEQWKASNEFLPYHPQASHVSPDYRDGWNACYRAAQQAAPVPAPEGALADAETLELAAKAVYRLFIGADLHPWVEGGNSLMQCDARRYARAALATRPSQAEWTCPETGRTCTSEDCDEACKVMLNGLTEAETNETASVKGLTSSPAEGDAVAWRYPIGGGRYAATTDEASARSASTDGTVEALTLAAPPNVQPKSTEPDEDLWTETQVVDICGAVKDHCGPATAARLRRLIETAQAPAPADGLCERICAAIKAGDDKSMAEAEYMLDSNDCIKIVRDSFEAIGANPLPIVDMVPPATSRDRWMYEQGRLAERDSRTAVVQAPAVTQQPLSDRQIMEGVAALRPSIGGRSAAEFWFLNGARFAERAHDIGVSKPPARHPKQIAGVGCALCGRNEAGYYCTGDCGEHQDATISDVPVQGSQS